MEENIINRMPGIGDKAPAFHAVTTQGEMDFPKDYSGKWVVLFSLQMDFTPVCTTELMIFASMIKEFGELDTELIGLSTASVYTHIAWLRKIKELAWKDMKHVEVSFPLIADASMEIAEKYAMLHHRYSKTQTVRAVYIIDPDGTIRAIQFYPASLGRNIQEIKRMIMALQKADRENASIPAQWMPGEDVILPPPKTIVEASDRMEKVNEDMYCLDWFLSFRQAEAHSDSNEKKPEFNPYPSSYPVRRRNAYHNNK